jgi:hypothetical protein
VIALTASDVADRIRNARPFPNGGVILTDTVVLRDLDGPPRPRTVTPGRRLEFVWRGNANVPVFSLQNCRESSWSRVDVRCDTPCEAVFRAERTRKEPGTVPSTMHQFRDVRVFGNGQAALYGFLWSDTIDANNEHARFESVSVYQCGFAWAFEGQQSKEHLFTHCRAESCAQGVRAESSFQWLGGTIAVCDVAFELARVGDPVVIQGAGVEACGRLLVSAGPATDAQSVTLAGVRYAADQLHADGAMVLLRHAGPLNVIGGSVGDGAQRPPRIQLAGIGEQACTVVGARFGAFGADRVAPVAWNPGVRPALTLTGCTYERAQGAGEHTSTTNPT